MRHYIITPSAALLFVALLGSTGAAQDTSHPHLHVNPKWKECSFQLDPSLTQSAWRRFTQEAGLVTYFRPLTDAKPMGAGKFELSVLQWQTNIDDHSSAWNDTFVHPDSAHWLIEGSGLAFPGLSFRAGVNKKVDVGAYFTKNVNANYGFYGGQVQYNLVNDETRDWAAATRVSFVSLYGPDDLKLNVYGFDLLASKEYALFSNRASVSPYAGVSSYISTSHETTSAVKLSDEQVYASQAMVGAVARVSRINLAVEYSSARVRSRSLKVGVTF